MSYRGTSKDFLHNYHIPENVEQITISLPFKTLTEPGKIKLLGKSKLKNISNYRFQNNNINLNVMKEIEIKIKSNKNGMNIDLYIWISTLILF